MKKILISVMLPVYNVSKYLRKSLESIINQTYKNLEIILVDDGSTDDSGAICDEYAKKDKRIKVIHKENGGLSSARNVGIENATGDYLYFMDSDDYIKLNFLERLLTDCVENDCEISACNFIQCFDNKEIPEQIIFKNEKLDSKEALKHLYLRGNFVTWNKLYKKEVFDKVRFPIGKIFANVMTTPLVFMNAKNIYLDTYYGYYYYQRNGSILNSAANIKKMDCIYNNLYMYDNFIKTNPYLEFAYNTNYIRCLITILEKFYNSRNKFKKEYKFLLNELKKYKKDYKKNEYINKKTKFLIFIYLHHLRFLLGIFRRIKKYL